MIDLREIEKLNAYAECLMDSNAMLGELQNRIAISDEIRNAKLTNEAKSGNHERKINERKERNEEEKREPRSENTTLRNRPHGSIEQEFIIDLAKPNDEDELRKARFASQFQEIGDTWDEINHENEGRSEEDQLSEMGDGAHVERKVFLTMISDGRKKSQL